MAVERKARAAKRRKIFMSCSKGWGWLPAPLSTLRANAPMAAFRRKPSVDRPEVEQARSNRTARARSRPPGDGSGFSAPCLELDLVDGLLHREEGLLEHRLLFGGQIDLVDLLCAAGADGDRHAHVVAVDAVLTLEQRRGRQHALLVLEVRLGHRDRAGSGRVKRGARLQKRDDLAAALACTLEDRL